MARTYDQRFYSHVADAATSSAGVIAPMVHALVEPASVVDVGCGLGSWAAAFARLGADVLGVDFGPLDHTQLRIPPDSFVTADLSRPLELGRSFDLVVALEVAEHLPAASADQFVDSLVGLGPIVLFSAAIPGQGGTHHVNEQWPDYWAERFADRGYRAVDSIRRQVWRHPEVAWWYAQNCLLFASDAALASSSELRRLHEMTSPQQLSMVHPTKYLDVAAADLVAGEIDRWIEPGASVVVVEYGSAVHGPLGDRPVIPFLEREGEFWGSPSDDKEAIAELDRERRAGARFIVFGRPSFWWLDHYGGFADHLRTAHRCVADNEIVVVFELADG